MIKPSLEEARKLSNENTIIPISLEILSDIKTPIEVLKCLKKKSNQCYLLESVEGGEKWGRYSFLGFSPRLRIRCKNNEVKIEEKEGEKIVKTNNPNEILRDILRDFKSPRLDFMPPFTGGLVGYVAYSYIKYFEKKLNIKDFNIMDADDLDLMLFDEIIAFDHLKQKIFIIVNIEKKDLENNYVNGVIRLKEIEAIIKSTEATGRFESKILSDFKEVYSKEKYLEMVEKTKKYIFEGDIFQGVISNTRKADFKGDLISTYRVLRTINPSPYMFYIDFNGIQIAGASPETLVKLNGSKLYTFPIAGTCPRGKTEEEDKELIENLLNNQKELAEHNMLVDLGRNDLGKISKFGSVEVKGYKEIMKFSHVSHITSTVVGDIRSELDQLDAIGAVLPAGTLSGAPKIRACEIINELEENGRGVYGGAIGYIDFSGNMDMCIAIRMVVKKDDQVYVSSGAGIVADSIGEKEYEEVINKSKAIIEALNMSQEVE